MKRTLYVVFGLAVAAMSAAIGDILVESLSDRGVFGPGRFTDGSTIDVAPVSIVGATLLLAFLLHRVRRVAPVFTANAVTKMLPLVFVVHMLMLFVMETLEQKIALGYFLGGTVWLGGPIAISILLHALLCAIVAYLALAAIRFLEPRAVQFIRAFLTVTVFPVTARAVVRRFDRPPAASRRLLIHDVAKRGPPAVHLSA
jgi:hypothetical protein